MHWEQKIQEFIETDIKFHDRFILAKEIGRGAFGRVIQARDSSPPRDAPENIAIKLPCLSQYEWIEEENSYPTTLDIVQGFIAEAWRHNALTLAKLDGIVPIIDMSAPAGLDLDRIESHVQKNPIWIAMPLYTQTLESYAGAQNDLFNLDAYHARRIMLEIAGTMQRLHEFKSDPQSNLEILHCDLKPQNILMDNDRPLVNDFGLSVSRRKQLSTGNRGGGTPGWQPPEQFDKNGPELNQKSDIFSWAAIFYWLLTKRRPHENIHDPGETISPYQGFPDSLGNERNVPIYLAPIIAKCLHLRQDIRYGSFSEVIDAIYEAERDASAPNFLPLTLSRQRIKRTAFSINDLHYSSAVTDYFKDNELFRNLQAFCDDPRCFLWWGLIGLGGVGKSRTALEFVKRKLGEGIWDTGFLRTDDADAWLRGTAKGWHPKRPTLIVLDYSFHSREAFYSCLLTFSNKSWQQGIEKGARVRVLFLDRPGSVAPSLAFQNVISTQKRSYNTARNGIREYLFKRSEEASDLQEPYPPLANDNELLSITGLPRENWRNFVATSLTRLTEGTQLKENAIAMKAKLPLMTDPWWDRIGRITGGSPLLLQGVAVLLAQTSLSSDGPIGGHASARSIFDLLLTQEINRYWLDFAQQTVPKHRQADKELKERFKNFVNAIGFITLCRGLDFVDHKAALENATEAEFDEIAGALLNVLTRDSLARNQSRNLPALKPDVFGECLLLNLVNPPPPQLPSYQNPFEYPRIANLSRWLEAGFQIDAAGTLETLRMTAQDFPELQETSKWCSESMRCLSNYLVRDYDVKSKDTVQEKGNYISERNEERFWHDGWVRKVVDVVMYISIARDQLPRSLQNELAELMAKCSYKDVGFLSLNEFEYAFISLAKFNDGVPAGLQSLCEFIDGQLSLIADRAPRSVSSKAEASEPEKGIWVKRSREDVLIAQMRCYHWIIRALYKDWEAENTFSHWAYRVGEVTSSKIGLGDRKAKAWAVEALELIVYRYGYLYSLGCYKEPEIMEQWAAFATDVVRTEERDDGRIAYALAGLYYHAMRFSRKHCESKSDYWLKRLNELGNHCFSDSRYSEKIQGLVQQAKR